MNFLNALVVFSSIFILCISYLYYSDTHDARSEDTSNTQYVINLWNKMIYAPLPQFQRLALGINSNIDVIVSGTALLSSLQVSPGIMKDHATVNNVNELQEVFSYYFSKGRAAERPFTDKDVYEHIIRTAETLEHVEHYIGGNAALMAKTASRLFPDLNIHFVGPVGSLLRSLLPKTLQIPSICKTTADEIHLIMEYKVGEQWGDARTSVATRFITSYDESNSKLLMMEPLFESMKEFNPDLIVLSGLHLLEGQGSNFFSQRLDKLISLCSDVPPSVPIHLELASMANAQFVKDILEKVLPYVDSIGLNEQEIIFASEAGGGPHSDNLYDDNGQPFIHKISDIILWIMKTFGPSTKDKSSRFSRVHFHSLTYHITATHGDAWSNTDAATAAGARVAGLQACDTHVLTEDNVDIKIPFTFKLFSDDEVSDFDPQTPVIERHRDGYLFVFSPVLVCKNPVKTVGLGDAISATGLMYSKFNKME